MGALRLVAAILILGTAVPVGHAAPISLEAFVTASPFATFTTDGVDGFGPTAKGISEFGLGGEALWRTSASASVGFGVRYDYGPDEFEAGHFISAPLILRLMFPRSTKGSEVRVGFGVGVAVGLFDYVHAVGLTLETAVGFRFPISNGLGWQVDVGVRYDTMGLVDADPDGFLAHATTQHLQFPFFRVGADWR